MLKREMLRFMSENDVAREFAGCDYAACTAEDKKRVDIAMDWIAAEKWGQGLYGAITELFACREKSRKYRIAAQGDNDTSVKFENYKGGIDYVRAEVKTGGGRVQNMSGKYTIYTYCHRQKRVEKRHGEIVREWYVERECAPIIVPTDLFMAFLYDHNAVKCTNGTHPETAIQPSNKALYEACEAWAVKYDRMTVYHEADFYGLTL